MLAPYRQISLNARYVKSWIAVPDAGQYCMSELQGDVKGPEDGRTVIDRSIRTEPLWPKDMAGFFPTSPNQSAARGAFHLKVRAVRLQLMPQQSHSSLQRAFSKLRIEEMEYDDPTSLALRMRSDHPCRASISDYCNSPLAPAAASHHTFAVTCVLFDH